MDHQIQDNVCVDGSYARVVTAERERDADNSRGGSSENRHERIQRRIQRRIEKRIAAQLKLIKTQLRCLAIEATGVCSFFLSPSLSVSLFYPQS